MKTERLLFLTLVAWPTVGLAQQDTGQLDWSLSFRPRYEFVAQDPFPDNANALTMRTLAGFTFRPIGSLSARVEFIDVSQFVDDFNDTRNGKVAFPIVVDPKHTDVNELYLEYSDAATITAGRQAVRLNRTRFIGAQDFRQTMQVFDGAVIDLPLPVASRLGNFSLYGAYFDRRTTVRAINRDDDVGVVRADWTWSSGNSLLLSAYWHDKQLPSGVPDTSYRIESIRWDGLHDVAWGAQLNYTFDYAKQRPYAGNQLNLEPHYARAGGGLIWSRAFVRMDYEVLGSRDGVYAFQTPLANNHAYLGWSDLFVVTPRQGIRDWWTTFGGNIGPVAMLVEHHQLQSDYADIDFGYETDFGAAWTLRKGLLGKLQFADYRSGDDPLNLRPNTTKVWLTVVWVVR
ncbi:MAG: alginate export family protein [Betaproteobacteria bacterium]|nr:MAG: alginate export family protein [Betaproteobacteria bacterium]